MSTFCEPASMPPEKSTGRTNQKQRAYDPTKTYMAVMIETVAQQHRLTEESIRAMKVQAVQSGKNIPNGKQVPRSDELFAKDVEMLKKDMIHFGYQVYIDQGRRDLTVGAIHRVKNIITMCKGLSATTKKIDADDDDRLDAIIIMKSELAKASTPLGTIRKCFTALDLYNYMESAKGKSKGYDYLMMKRWPHLVDANLDERVIFHT